MADGSGPSGELLEYLVRQLVDEPDAVRVETEERDGALVLVLHVAPDDVGKVIGRGRLAGQRRLNFGLAPPPLIC